MELGRAQHNPSFLTVAVGLTGLCPLSRHSVAIFCSCQKPSVRVWPVPAKWPVRCVDLGRPGSLSSNAIRWHLSELQSNYPAIRYQTAKAVDSALRWLTFSSMKQFPQARVSRTLTKITIHEALGLQLSIYMRKIFYHIYQRLAKYRVNG